MKLVISLAIAMFVVAHVSNDSYQYQTVKRSSYETPWYSNSWIKEPFTMLMLTTNGKDSRDYWKTNVMNEYQHIREITLNDKTYWTVLDNDKKRD